jgi:hypothetical protein
MAETRSRRSPCRSTGVWPRGAQVRRTVGVNWKPDSSATARCAFRRRAFFNARPDGSFPRRDRRLIAFERATRGRLARPAQVREEAANVGPMIPDATRAANHLGNAGRRPQVGTEAPGQRAALQQLRDALLLARREFRRTARTGLAARPAGPCAVIDCRQRTTELCEQPIRRATSVTPYPCSRNAAARRRRASSSA